MYFDSVQAALTMDGHGVYVWPAYTITLLVLGYLLISPVRGQKKLLRELRGEIRRTQQRARQGGQERTQENMQQAKANNGAESSQ